MLGQKRTEEYLEITNENVTDASVLPVLLRVKIYATDVDNVVRFFSQVRGCQSNLICVILFVGDCHLYGVQWRYQLCYDLNKLLPSFSSFETVNRILRLPKTSRKCIVYGLMCRRDENVFVFVVPSVLSSVLSEIILRRYSRFFNRLWRQIGRTCATRSGIVFFGRTLQ